MWRIVAAALAVRMLVALTVAGSDNLPAPGADRFFFVETARLLADGRGYLEPFSWRVHEVAIPTAGHPPLWSAVLAVPALAGLDGAMVARLLGGLLGAATAGVVVLIGRRLAGERAGRLAGWVVALFPVLVVADVSGMSEALYLLLVVLAVLLALVHLDSGRLRWAAAAGVLAGLAALTRTEGLLLVPLVLWPAAALAANVPGRRRLAAAAVATALTLAVIAPWTARNLARFDEPVLVATNVSAVAAGANCPTTYAGPEMGSWSVQCVFAASGTFDPRDFDESVLAARWQAAGEAYASANSGRLPAVAVVRVLRTWNLWQPRRQLILQEGQNRSLAPVVLLSFYLLLAAALLGLRRMRGRWHRGWLLVAALPVIVTATSAIGWGSPRFLHPAEVTLALVAAAAWAGVSLRGSGSRSPAPSR